MPNQPTELQPETARTPGEYVAQLRRLRTLSGLTYREIADRADTAGEVLPASTLAAMLGRATLPREQAVAALIRACGLGPDEVARWLDARRRLAVSEAGDSDASMAYAESDGLAEETRPACSATDPEAADAPVEPTQVDTRVASGRPRRGWLTPAALGFVAGAAVATVTAVVLLPVGSPPDSHQVPNPRTSANGDASVWQPAEPAPGPYRLRLAHTGLCVSERPDSDLGHLFQTACAAAMPSMTLTTEGDRVFRIRTDHPRFGAGCMGVDQATRDVNGVVADSFCDTGGGQDFRFEPVTVPALGYRIRPVHSDMCLGVANSATNDWAPVRQLACDANASGQIFLLDPV
ncbi:XRE family transcriptional regulator [Micromonospora peucetia]|uniref:XRE family transcriptional regulator n=1 Tax=Micromonospora peucetia TaxID=47871 RepID=A0ABZ1E8I4_9ACTN|nr:helix-turn-helix domain-containing protein [Micromonospora peucetia]MCX4388183.1 XRE family transcriptional regulator [Micromonospora peucetia]WSA31134.1 XRE family transcriptional regulator [Micromonospora peucetia]